MGEEMSDLRPFHLAFPVNDISVSRKWYTEVLGCEVGRESDHSCVLNLFGHQVVAHLVEEMPEIPSNDVDGKKVPALHFGCVLEWKHWHELKDRLLTEEIAFAIEPYFRYKGESGEQATMFFTDPSGNHLEFKSFKNDVGIFRRNDE